MKNSKIQQLALLAGACFVLVGCRNVRPPFSSPGTIGFQRSQAVLHDPFPSDDLGPPIVGMRPRGFERPLSEVVDSQGSPFAKLPLRRQGSQVAPYTGF